MKTGLIAASLLLALGGSAFGHRLDEYLQATIIMIDKDRVQAQIHLTPGVAVFRYVMAAIDTDRDGVISPPEQQAYAERVLGDLSLSLDGGRLQPVLVSTKFPEIDEMKEGLGDIQIDFVADVPGDRRKRTLTFETRHQSAIAAYLVNCLAPRDPDIRVTKQHRNYEQSLYQVDYFQGGARTGPLSLAWWSGGPAWIGGIVVLLLVRLAGLWRQRSLQAA